MTDTPTLIDDDEKARELYDAHCREVPGPPSRPWSYAPEWVKRKFRREAAALRARESTP